MGMGTKAARAAAMGAMALTMALAAAGCGGAPSAGGAAEYGPGEPPLMSASHQGRYESLGMAGCYGCHGANEATDHMLAAAPALPADHYVDGDVATFEVFGPRGECITCHPQG
ncbi:hypothetical protein [Parvibacter caecicola]|uniref:Cytochrome c-type protein NapB n=1 Tax=Parvibacter caecicola TaxID=747645 RepID=A0A7W5CZU3_9ACTN|nr:hypothetical protein [Parvibacter caecicola]MBB3170288.1 cytochrome c-type protein NapB [Parvibacter caecicola]MCR2041746.1 hypothetical protein [Parvibacter caecicola]RNL10497.1 hypothetical protein DMP11_07155 [Parvibacter caecicola]